MKTKIVQNIFPILPLIVYALAGDNGNYFDDKDTSAENNMDYYYMNPVPENNENDTDLSVEVTKDPMKITTEISINESEGSDFIPEDSNDSYTGWPISISKETDDDDDYVTAEVQQLSPGAKTNLENLTRSFIRPTIMGGSNVTWEDRSSYPYQLSVQWRRGSKFVHICGATIVTAKAAVSAGHCFDEKRGQDPSRFRIVAGDLNLIRTEGPEQVRTLSAFTIHPHYDGNRGDHVRNDISILHWTKDLKFNKFVNNVRLPDPKDDFTGHETILTGWGRLGYGATRVSTILQKATLPILSRNECSKFYPKFRTHHDSYGDDALCAGMNGVDACRGDSGGPLVFKNRAQYLLVGLVSFGESCSFSHETPGVYTRVSKFTPWIRQELRRNGVPLPPRSNDSDTQLQWQLLETKADLFMNKLKALVTSVGELS